VRDTQYTLPPRELLPRLDVDVVVRLDPPSTVASHEYLHQLRSPANIIEHIRNMVSRHGFETASAQLQA
jgi:hypothetical protein